MAERLLIFVVLLILGSTALATPPDGFTRTVMAGEYSEIIGITPLGDGRMLGYERGGVVWILNEEDEASEAISTMTGQPTAPTSACS